MSELCYEEGTILHWLSRSGNIELIKLLLANSKININILDNMGYAPLHYAVSHGHKKIVELLLLREEIDIDVQDYDGVTPLDIAIGLNNPNIIQLLVDSGANPTYNYDTDEQTMEYNQILHNILREYQWEEKINSTFSEGDMNIDMESKIFGDIKYID